jgi:tellurite resistance protein TehA-like permease
MKTQTFNPLTFLASLGAGGIAVVPFGYFQYAIQTEKGLITYSQLMNAATSTADLIFFFIMQTIMIVFASLHFALTFKFFKQLISWKKTKDYRDYISNPQKNSGYLAMFTSLAMTFNVFIGVVRFFVPALSNNFQDLMLPALIVWGVLWFVLMSTEIKLLKTSFQKDFDVAKISFGWLQHPFALGMVTVAGTGIAALSANPSIAHIAAFMSLISGSMGMFLFMVKLISIFKSHFAMKGVPERQFLPSFLIVIPITTIYAIAMFRMGHYFQHWFNFDSSVFSTLVVVIPFAFQTWYMAFGISMLKDYFKKDFFRKEYYVSLWAFVCPFVGYAMLGAFMYKFFVPNVFTQFVIFASILTAVGFFIFIGLRYFKYEYKVESKLIKSEVKS